MATEITMPKLSDTMTEGKFGAWKKAIGESVQRGDVIAEVETDKAVMDLEAFASGIMLEQRVTAGELVRVGAVLGLIGAPGEAVVPSGPSTQPDQATPLPAVASEPELAREEAVPVSSQPREPHEEQAAPLVRRRARELGVDLAQVPGSGPGGRIVLEDLARYQESSSPTAKQEAAPDEAARGELVEPASGLSPDAVAEERPLSRMRAAIARTVSESWRNIPHFYVTIDVVMDAAEEVRRELKESDAAVSVNDLVIKGAALAIGSYPLVNASFAGDRLVINKAINIGMAVSLAEGLLVPVLRGCEGLDLQEIAHHSRRLAERARDGKLSETELAGGTFSISNLGMYGVSGFAAVILPPQAAILAVGAIREIAVVRNGLPVAAKVMTLTLSADHRVLDGSYAAEFLGEMKKMLENPVKLLL
jgi:pyruvate dehydrogenase E2 component (dihydrolipoamide acetyltransferase)